MEDGFKKGTPSSKPVSFHRKVKLRVFIQHRVRNEMEDGFKKGTPSSKPVSFHRKVKLRVFIQSTESVMKWRTDLRKARQVPNPSHFTAR